MAKFYLRNKLPWLTGICFAIALLVSFGASANSLTQGGITVTGSVSDNGTLMPGVTVTVKGTAIGVLTNSNGEFTINVPDESSILEFNFLGYITEEMLVGSRRIFNVSMIEDGMNIDAVTVVAFGTQKKESVTASITTINPAELKVPSSNLTTALAGNMAGIIAYQRSGEPGQDNAEFFIRGITTFGTHNSPLILIDGVELTSTDLARLQPDDIASFSIMKDATATALYGARGANGVVLVTTKQGTVGPAKVQIRYENSFSAPTRKVQLADPVTYMQLNNEAVYTRMNMRGQSGQETPPYSQQKIDNTILGTDPILYPANDWMKMLMKNFTTTQRANMNVSGGGGVARYFVAASLNHDNGMFKVDSRNNFNNNISNTTYTLRSNINLDLTKSTELIFRFSGAFDDYSGPLDGGKSIYNKLVHSNPVEFLPYYEGGEDYAHINHIMFGNAAGGSLMTNPYADMVKGYKEQSRSQVLAQMEIKQNLDFITEGLSLRGMMNLTRLSQFSVNRFYTPFYYSLFGKDPSTGDYIFTQLNDNGTEFLDYSENAEDKATHSTFYFEGMVNYDRTFNDRHSVSGLLVYQMTETLKANTGSLQRSLPARNIGLSGRATYSFDRRYFAEFNFGYNGSERFHKDHRFGFFPSVGAAWLISNESFWGNIKPVVSNLKLRYSYGKVGNDRIGSDADRFFYLSEVNLRDSDRSAVFGNEFRGGGTGVSIKRYANADISWETSIKQNFALEIGLWNKLSIIAEYFTENRSNILMSRASVPATLGLSSTVKANIGEATGKGVDLALEYQHVINPEFWASARGNFTFARSKYKKFEEPAYDEYWRYKVGYSINQRFGYIAERLFVDDEEAANSPRQYVGGSNAMYGGGDVKYLDVNRDGVINERDMVPIGYPEVPEIVYGFGFSMGYKQFDFSAFFQGSARVSFWMNAAATSPFVGQTQLLRAYANDHWSEENQNIYALWPRLSTDINTNNVPGGSEDRWGKSSTWFMRNGAFLRLKQAEIGYTFSGNRKWQQKARLSTIRLYASGTNLFLLSKFKLWDVEMGDNGLGYPLQRVFNLGINITFN